MCSTATAPTRCAPSGRGQVLIPWPNRLEDGSYEFDGRRHQLALTSRRHTTRSTASCAGRPGASAQREPHRVVIEHVLHPQPGYPFSLALRIEYSLSDAGLSVRRRRRTSGPTPVRTEAVRIRTYCSARRRSTRLVLRVPGRTVLCSDDRGLPTGTASVDGTEYDFRRAEAHRRDEARQLLHRPRAGRRRSRARRARRSESGTRSRSGPTSRYAYLMLFTGDPLPDVNRRSLAVEPMTCPPNAFRTGEALIRLEPGGSFTSSWGIAPAELAEPH